VVTVSCAPVKGDIFNELDKWRDARNEYVHAFCKLDDYSYADNSEGIFSEKMWDTAEKRREIVYSMKTFQVRPRQAVSRL